MIPARPWATGGNKPTMLKQVRVHGQSFLLKSRDGRLWCTDMADILLAERQRVIKDRAFKASAWDHKVLNVLDRDKVEASDQFGTFLLTYPAKHERYRHAS